MMSVQAAGSTWVLEMYYSTALTEAKEEQTTDMKLISSLSKDEDHARLVMAMNVYQQ